MKRFLFAAALFFAALRAIAAEVVPADLVGVWATDRSDLRGALVFEGLAVYLGADGVGAIVGGPPPIGVRIVFSYNPDKKAIEYQATEGQKTGPVGSIAYDSAQQVIRLDKDTLRRRFDQLTDPTRKALGLEPTNK
jgi:opacity protein-like surface antigen